MKTTTLLLGAASAFVIAACAQTAAQTAQSESVEEQIIIRSSDGKADKHKQRVMIVHKGSDGQRIEIVDGGLMVDGHAMADTMEAELQLAMAELDAAIAELDREMAELDEADVLASETARASLEQAKAELERQVALLDVQKATLNGEMSDMDVDFDFDIDVTTDGENGEHRRIRLKSEDIEGASSIVIKDGKLIIDGEEVENHGEVRHVVVKRVMRIEVDEDDETNDTQSEQE